MGIILRQMKYMHWIQWMVDAWGEVKATPVQSVEPEQFFQDGCQTTQAMTPIFNWVWASIPLHLVWKFGWDPSSPSKDRAPTNIKKRKNWRSAKRYLPEKFFPGGNKVSVKQIFEGTTTKEELQCVLPTLNHHRSPTIILFVTLSYQNSTLVH